jgi:DNA-binding CsgD family transcriptional regulator
MGQLQIFYTEWVKDNLLFILVFMSQLLFVIIDGYDDFIEHNLSTHTLIHIIFGGGALVGLLALLVSFRRKKLEMIALHDALNASRSIESKSSVHDEKEKQYFIRIVQQQFDAWQLSDTERETALLLLKGLTLEEIASIKNRATKTVRMQASNIYSKAGLSGRHELAAYFFEDLLDESLYFTKSQ